MPLPLNIYRSNTYRRDLGWLYFDDNLRDSRFKFQDSREVASVEPTILDNYSCIASNISKFQIGVPAQT